MDQETTQAGLGEEAEPPKTPGVTTSGGVPAFLRRHQSEILSSWESRVTSEGHDVVLTGLALRDDVPVLLEELAIWLASAAAPETSLAAAGALAHVMQRLDQGLLLGQVFREYRLLREAIIEVVLNAAAVEQEHAGPSSEQRRVARIKDLARLNAGLDIVLSQSIEQFVAERDRRAEVERDRAAQAVRESETRYRTLFDSIDEGFCIVEVFFEDDRAVDCRFLSVNPAFEAQAGLENATGKRVGEMVPELEEQWLKTYGGVARTGEPSRIEDAIGALGRSSSVSAFRVGAPEEHQVAILFSDITARKHAAEALHASEARQTFLVRLGDTLHPLVDAVAIQTAAARVLREHLGASRVHFAEVEPDGEHASGVPDRAGRYLLADFPRAADEIRAGRSFVVDDVATDPRLAPEEKANYLALPAGALVVVPVQDQGRFAALLSVHRTSSHAWSQDEVTLIQETAARTKDAVFRAKAEIALRASEERFRQALESMSDGCAILSPDWTYLFINKVNAEQARVKPEHMLGRSMLEVVPGVESSPFFAAYRRSMEERTPQHMESEFTYEDGASAWFEVSVVPVAEGILVRAQDTTARKRNESALRDGEELVRTIAENSTQALVMMDARGHCTYWNPALLAMTGYTAEELRSKPLHELIHHHRPDGRPYPMAECPIDRALPENFDVRAHEDLFFRKDGTTFPVLCAASPIMKGGRPVATVIEVQDITERKHAEEALREADRRKDEFIAILAHELRNPLAPVRSAVEILRQLGPAEPRLMRAREVIDRQVTHMARLIDDLLDVSRITQRKLALQRERCDAAALVRQTAEDYRSSLIATGVKLDVEASVTPLWVDADPVRLTQMVGNLLNNASRFTDQGGRVQIHVARSGPWVEVVVADTGVGIEPTLLARLFDPFSQAEQDLARSKGGLGLGLALTKGLVELHGGEIIAESPGVGRGSTFRLRMPAAADSAAHTVAAPPLPSGPCASSSSRTTTTPPRCLGSCSSSEGTR